ncbi:sugar phosphate isomerase/epimerase [Aminobacter aminovorans]|uniref:Xylose isomerase-like TIM barrel n=1 Tax=Aminobacter aminovorans TaxID=83263 RepID=A0A380WFR0_AMIAI|nr:sugar phosphate isomerase/epimerase family protein [Aminobacter aminovorans]TCS27088.1 sugar phosphate isomerase/epimerase [Aminobacter aminovorans]SUU87853.1 Xylose isomerase-like TIM barrel [Aminobacter aminovorans]
MRLGIDGRKIPEARKRGPIGSIEHAAELGLEGTFFRTVLEMSPSLDSGELRAIRQRSDELGMYLETGLGKINPYATPETPELRQIGDGDILLGFRRMMEICAEIDCRELWVGTASSKGIYPRRWSVDRFRTDVSWDDQMVAIEKFLGKLVPIALDLGIHINIETHEEITSFEILRLLETFGTDALGVVYDSSNGLQRCEHPVMAARRVAPYVRQTHLKDAAVVPAEGGALMQFRPCGQGVIDFRAVLAIVLAANPDVNLTIENEEPSEEREKPYAARLLEIHDESWLSAHPDLTLTEYAAYTSMMMAFQARIASGTACDIMRGTRPFGYAEAIADIMRSADHIREACGALS